MDLLEKKESLMGDNGDCCDDDDNQWNEMNNRKCCADCRTTITPLWRLGPSGPKSLCNACGIRYRKRVVSVMRVRKGNFKRERTQSHRRDKKETNGGSDNEGLKVNYKLMGLVNKKKQLGEEEQAAVLLMALSCGSVFG